MPSLLLRLLAGKFGTICTAFPLTTFLANILIGSPLIFPVKSKFNIPHLEHKLTKKFDPKYVIFFSQKISILNLVKVCVQDGILYDDIMLNEQLEIYLQK